MPDSPEELEDFRDKLERDLKDLNQQSSSARGDLRDFREELPDLDQWSCNAREEWGDFCEQHERDLDNDDLVEREEDKPLSCGSSSKFEEVQHRGIMDRYEDFISENFKLPVRLVKSLVL